MRRWRRSGRDGKPSGRYTRPTWCASSMGACRPAGLHHELVTMSISLVLSNSMDSLVGRLGVQSFTKFQNRPSAPSHCPALGDSRRTACRRTPQSHRGLPDSSLGTSKPHGDPVPVLTPIRTKQMEYNCPETHGHAVLRESCHPGDLSDPFRMS